MTNPVGAGAGVPLPGLGQLRARRPAAGTRAHHITGIVKGGTAPDSDPVNGIAHPSGRIVACLTSFLAAM